MIFKKNLLAFVILIPFVFSSCSKDDVAEATIVNSKVYNLGAEELQEYQVQLPLSKKVMQHLSN
jgi:hypothetical protein